MLGYPAAAIPGYSHAFSGLAGSHADFIRVPHAMLERVQAGELDPSFLLTHRMSLEESPRGYEIFKKKEDGCLRAAFAP